MKKSLTKRQEQLVLDNLRLVKYQVHRHVFFQNQDDFDEYVSIGTFGLIKAAMTFDPNQNVQFQTYACKCILTELLKEMQRRKKANELLTSLDETIANKSNNDSFLFSETLSDTSSNFEEALLEKEEFIESMNIILNGISKEGRIILLFKIAGWSDIKIGSSLGMTRFDVYTTRQRTLRLFSIRKKDHLYSKKCSFSIVRDDLYKVTLCMDAKKFNEAFGMASVWFQKMFSLYLPTYKCAGNDIISLVFPADEEYFAFIGKLFFLLK